MDRLKGKVAIITGGASGMGVAYVRLFTKEGARVVSADVQDDMGKQVVQEVKKDGGEAVYMHLDVTNEKEWQSVIAATVKQYGKLDVLVNNAGVGGGFAPLHEYLEKDWDQVMAVNSTGVFLGTKHAIPEMRKVGGGSIINVSSIYGLVGTDSGAAYPASKGAVRIFSKAAAIQYAKENIRVNSLHPGFIDTPQAVSLVHDPVERKKLIDRTPLGWIATPEHIAWGGLFLASDESSYITGTELVIDGGITAQ
ncbi:MAG: glucose 1-dehydrogenase [Chloroflexi bacterium]|nr:glucose 1-dehydrogenase [Chloroflexota bacterium]